MAYNKHPLKTTESHYNKPALVTIVLILMGIGVLVAIKQLSPEMGAELGITSSAQASTTVTPPAMPATPVETKITPTSTVKEAPQKTVENAPSTQSANDFHCTEKDISAGLCKQ